MDFILIIAIFVFLVIAARSYNRQTWKKFPTVDEYMETRNPVKGRGIACYKCGSRQIWEQGFIRLDSPMRIHFCKQCKTALYRTGN